MNILLTGGSGCLGRELLMLLPGVQAPPSSDLDITKTRAIDRVLDDVRPDVIVHGAAYTDVAGAETDRKGCWHVNVEGTRKLAQAAGKRGIFLVKRAAHVLRPLVDGVEMPLRSTWLHLTRSFDGPWTVHKRSMRSPPVPG